MNHTIAERIAAACERQHSRTGAVLPLTVCEYCKGCALGLIFGVGASPAPRQVPVQHVPMTEAWLDQVEARS